MMLLVTEELGEIPDATAAESLIGRTDLMAPDVLLVEAANVLAKKVRSGQIPRAQADEGIKFLQVNVSQLVSSVPLLARAIDFSVAMSHPVYDCIFLACAEAASGQVATRDGRLAARAEKAGFANLISSFAGGQQQ